ncbi:coiled-coil domain-containing protein 186 [Engraulis encrasicolus]|uniref:coiled-coil domain-containing protein 186 n=1 Tax=Engraulis encrasicolus TaxID=184585 RepID=UPI002FCED4C4
MPVVANLRLFNPQRTAPEDVKRREGMEQSDHPEGDVVNATVAVDNPQLGSEVNSPSKASEAEVVIVANGNNKLGQESDGEEQDSAQELDSTRSENGERSEVSTDSMATAASPGGANTSCDSGTSSMDDARTPTGAPDVSSPECSSLPSVGAMVESSPLPPAVGLIQESSPAVLDGVAELSPVSLDGMMECSGLLESSSAVLDGTMASSLSPAGLDTTAEGLSVDGGSSALTPTQTQMEITSSPTHAQGEVSVPVSSVSNGPSANAPDSHSVNSTRDPSPSATPDLVTDTLGKNTPPSPSPAQAPGMTQTPPNTPAAAANPNPKPNASSSPFDTDCSRRSMSEIQRSVSQESLLEELESELLSCQLTPSGTAGDRATAAPLANVTTRASPPNGLPRDFEKCVQYKYSQQEKAIKKLLEENKRHQELILGICSEKDNMRDELKRRIETEKQHVATVKKYETRVEELLKELKESRDKQQQQDLAAKHHISQIQRETAYRLEQVRGTHTHTHTHTPMAKHHISQIQRETAYRLEQSDN